MKTVKLKPIFFPNDDILVKPPSFIDLVEDPQVAGGKNKTFSNTDQLKNLLKGRRRKKQPVRNDDEEETVKKLEDWKGNESPKSPLRKKFTFRRGVTSREDSSEPVRGKNSLFTLAPVMDIEIVANVFQSIVAVERMKKKNWEAEAKRMTEANLMLEQGIKAKINRVSKQLEGIKAFLNENQQKLEELKAELQGIELTHEEKMHEIALNEAQELLFSEKVKKKLIKPGEESQYFIKKEKIRQLKQDLHKKYQEDKEFLTSIISKTQTSIKATENLRQEGKKDLKNFREELTQLYCRALKDAKDIRTDGLRWVIKSLWKMKECVPVSAFPKFFDEDSCHFLVLVSEKDLELEGLSQKLEALRKEIKQRKNSYSIKTTRELYKNIRTRLRLLSQSSIGEDLNKPPEAGLAEDLDRVDSTTNANYLQLSVLREKISEVQDFIKDFSNQEIKRITDNYQLNPGEAQSVGLFHLIRCLVGDRVREFNRYTRASKANNRVRSVNQ